MSETKCISCGLCVKVCYSKAVDIASGSPVIDESKCNLCDHCAAICPTDAIEVSALPLGPLAGAPFEADEAERFLRYARSVRFYKPDLIGCEDMTKLINIGRYAQTASNTQGISYMVVEGRDKVIKLADLLCEVYETLAKDDPDLAWVAPRVADYKSGNDCILRGAPELILALSENGVRRRQNAQYSLTFIALLAPSMGIGTCWAGIFERFICHEVYGKPFREHLGLPEGTFVDGALMVGYPDVTFRRLAERNPLKLDWF